MRSLFNIVLWLFLLATSLQGQVADTGAAWVNGKVSFLSSRNVYVKFSSTKGITVGDTLYINRESQYLPAMQTDNKSSTSAVCTPFAGFSFQKEDLIYAKIPVDESLPPPSVAPAETTVPKDEAVNGITPVLVPEEDQEQEEPGRSLEKIRTRLSAASYSSRSEYRELHRMRYAFSFRGDHLKDSRFSTEQYITFRHTLGEWEEVQDNLSNALKVYALSVRYDFDSTSNLTLGRRINPNMSSVGAIDGLQYEQQIGAFTLGGIAGFRPDYSDYSFNPSLLEAGGYLALTAPGKQQSHRTTVGFLEQTNQGQTDRRFLYFQHRSTPFEGFNLFSSVEADLYENLNSEVQNKLSLTSLYLSMRYRVNKKIRLSLSYDNRRNVIYYESYKSFIDQLIQDETRQGLRFSINLRPAKLLTLGVNTGWRFQRSDRNQSKNLRAFLTWSKIPRLNMRASLSATLLQTNYIKSQIYDLRLSRPIIKKRLDGDVYFRTVHYEYQNTGSQVDQKIAGASLSLRIRKQLSLLIFYEGTFIEQEQPYQRINTKIIQRF